MKTRVISIRLGVEKVELLDDLSKRNNLNRNQMVSALIDGAIRQAQKSDQKGDLVGMLPITRYDVS